MNITLENKKFKQKKEAAYFLDDDESIFHGIGLAGTWAWVKGKIVSKELGLG